MFDILHEEDDWFAIDKPTGISVHNAEDKSIIDHYVGVNPVHRLDKDTSGILVLAKNAVTTAKLQIALQQGVKTYRCVCRKNITQEQGVWEFPLSEKAQGAANPQGARKDQKRCRSTWQVLQTNTYFSTLEVVIATGRTHQIRRHAALAGHHIIGDSRYGERRFNKKIATIYGTSRMFLHAMKLELCLEGRAIAIFSGVPRAFNSILDSAT